MKIRLTSLIIREKRYYHTTIKTDIQILVTKHCFHQTNADDNTKKQNLYSSTAGKNENTINSVIAPPDFYPKNQKLMPTQKSVLSFLKMAFLC